MSESPPTDDAGWIEACRLQSLTLLRGNLTPEGILASHPGPRAEARGYTAIFGRDAAVCALGMALSGDAELEAAAPAGLLTLARFQAPNGQMPKFVDVRREEADFWYLGCIDSSLWWLIGIDFLDRRNPEAKLRQRLQGEIERCIQWLQAQEHQRFYLVQQNEASDWADIMPRSGFVLYTNALWYWVKCLYGIPHDGETRDNANHLFHPFRQGMAEYKRARLLVHYVKRQARNQDLYLSFVNFAFFGDEGDVFGNLLAILCGLADGPTRSKVLRALTRARVADPYPIRVVCEPIRQASRLWRPYMSRHRQNLVWQYHNGGIWPMVGGFWVAALSMAGWREQAAQELAKLARANELGNWQFNEWLHGRTLQAQGMPKQSWNAAAFLLGLRALEGEPIFCTPGRKKHDRLGKPRR